MSNRGYSCRTDLKHQSKSQVVTFDPSAVYINKQGKYRMPVNFLPDGRELTSQEKISYKLYAKQKPKMDKVNQLHNKTKKENKNIAQIHQFEFLDYKQLAKKQERDKKTQLQISKKHYKQNKVDKKYTKQTERLTINQSIQEISPLSKKREQNDAHLDQNSSLQHSKMGQSMIILNIEKDSSKFKTDQQIKHALSANSKNTQKYEKELEKKDIQVMKQIVDKYQNLSSQIDQKLKRIELIPSQIQVETEKSMITRFQRLLDEQRQKITTQWTIQRQEFLKKISQQYQSQSSKINSQLQTQFNKFNNQISSLKQIVMKGSNQGYETYNLGKIQINQKNQIEKQLQAKVASLNAELDRKQLIVKQYEMKINERERQLEEEYQGRIRSITHKSQQRILQLQFHTENLKRQLELQRKKAKVQYQQSRDILCSNLLNFSSLLEAKSFIKNQIEAFQSKTVDVIQLVFQKDHKNSNFGVYMDGSFSFLLLVQTQKDIVFGAFSNGFYHLKSSILENLPQKQKIKAFLFNINSKQIFINDRKTDVNAVQYRESMLTFGNTEMVVKNNNIEKVKVNVNNIIGECYYTVNHRRNLTGEESDQIRIKRLQIHRVHFKKE